MAYCDGVVLFAWLEGMCGARLEQVPRTDLSQLQSLLEERMTKQDFEPHFMICAFHVSRLIII